MDNIFINLGDMVSVGQDSVSVFDSNNILSTSDTLVGPQGPPGPPGRDGRDGLDGEAATIQVGTTTTTEPGTNAVVTNSGDSHNAVFNFSIPRGATGEMGPSGQDGVDGEDGFSPEAYVTQNPAGATITITDASGTTAADVYNGPAGPAATIAVGSTTTGNPGTNASVTNSGTSSAAIFDFTIPRGADGQNGQDGSAATIAVGNVSTGSAGSSASVTNTGTSSAAVFDFVIPRGDTGAAGQDGQDGQDGSAATITVGSTTTGNAGTNASVTNSGTSSAAVLDFVIPRGADGQNGQDGTSATIAVGTTTTLPAGSSATVTNSGTSSAAVFNFGIPKGADAQFITGRIPTRSYVHGGSTYTVNITTQANTNYIVILTHEIGAGNWNNIQWRVGTKTTNSFTVNFYNTGDTSDGDSFAWVLIPQ